MNADTVRDMVDRANAHNRHLTPGQRRRLRVEALMGVNDHGPLLARIEERLEAQRIAAGEPDPRIAREAWGRLMEKR